MNQAPDERGRSRSHRRSSQAAEAWQTLELLTSPTEASRFHFPFINSGRQQFQRGSGGREVLEGQRRARACYIAIIIPHY